MGLFSSEQGAGNAGEGWDMKKVFLIADFIILISSPLYSLDYTMSGEKLKKANEYIAHCNFAFGPSIMIGGKISGSHGLNLKLVDRFNDTYYFSYNPDDDNTSLVGFNIMVGFPFYYQDYFSVGMYGQTLLNGLSGDDLLLYYGGGIYAEGIYKHFSLRLGLGIFGLNSGKSVGRVAPAWKGDPGYYTGTRFIEPGEHLRASSYDFLGVSFNVAFKYYPFKDTKGFLGVTFLQLGYYFFPSIAISDYRLNLAGVDVVASGPLPSFEIESTHNISLLLGFGL
jgi:hypothetical protein